MAMYPSILAWRILWTEKPGRLHTVHGVARVGHNLAIKPPPPEWWWNLLQMPYGTQVKDGKKTQMFLTIPLSLGPNAWHRVGTNDLFVGGMEGGREVGRGRKEPTSCSSGLERARQELKSLGQRGKGGKQPQLEWNPHVRFRGGDRRGLERAGTSGFNTKLKRQALFSRGRSWVNELF